MINNQKRIKSRCFLRLSSNVLQVRKKERPKSMFSVLFFGFCQQSDVPKVKEVSVHDICKIQFLNRENIMVYIRSDQGKTKCWQF